jgi:hypothetical protein
MPNMIRGVVRDGKIVSEQTLPEGTEVQMIVPDEVFIIPPDLREEMAAWARGSAQALELIERLAPVTRDD